MSGSIAQPIGNNVVPFPPQQQPGGAPPGLIPNPAFAAWQQQAEQVRAVMAHNQQLQAQFDAAVALIKKDGLHGFRLDIEADSTIAPDEQAEKASRVEFLQQMVPLLENVMPLAQGNPPIASLAKEIVLFAARGFRVARPLEEALEQAMDAIAGMPPVPPKGAQHGPTQNPQIEQAKVAADVHDTQTKAGVQMQQIAQKQQQAVLQAQAAAERTAAEDRRANAQMALQAAEAAQRGELERMRAEHLAARTAEGLR